MEQLQQWNDQINEDLGAKKSKMKENNVKMETKIGVLGQQMRDIGGRRTINFLGCHW